MASRFKGCTAARRVTGIAVTGTAGIVRPATTGEGCGGMTGGAVEAGRNVGGYGIHHADRGSTIMTRDAIVDDTGMIEGCRAEVIGVMADAAILIGVHMAIVFSGGEIAIMTGLAVILDTLVIKGCGFKTRSLVAIDAITVSRHMVVVFSGGGAAIVTGRTVTLDSLVIKMSTGKGRGVMAHRAILGGRNVVGVHTCCRTSPIGYMA